MLEPATVGGGDGLGPVTAADVAARVGGMLSGDPSIAVTGIAALDRASRSDLSIFAHPRYGAWFATTQAGIVLISPELADAPGHPGARIVVQKPIEAIVPMLARFHRDERRPVGVHPTAVVSATAVIGEGVAIEAFAVLGDDVEIGAGSWIGPHAVVGAASRLGRDVRVFAHATVYPLVEIGDRVVLHSGARVGREGFGFVPGPSCPTRIPHVGRCVLEHDVEIGANSCVDRGSIDDTIIGAGTKIDSLVHVAHNVRIGRLCFLAAQVGIAGSARLQDGVQLGGQVGVGGHLTIGARASVGGQGGVIGDVPEGEMWSGYPARPHREAMRGYAAISRLARMVRPLEQLLQRDRGV